MDGGNESAQLSGLAIAVSADSMATWFTVFAQLDEILFNVRIEDPGYRFDSIFRNPGHYRSWTRSSRDRPDRADAECRVTGAQHR